MNAAVDEWKRRRTPVTADGLRTYVLDEGMGDPVVMLHGIPTQAFLWRHVARVVSRERRVIAPDLLGFGFADKPAAADLSPQGQARYIARVLEIIGVDSFSLVGHDYGALVCAELLAMAPDRVQRLAIMNTSVSREDWSASGFNPLAALRVRGLGEATLAVARPFMLTTAFRIFTADTKKLTREVMSVYWRPFEEGFDRILLALYRNRQLGEQDFCRYRDALAAFSRPALVAWGDLDPAFTSWRGRQIASLLPNARFELFEHANHFIQEDRPEALGRLLNAFLRA